MARSRRTATREEVEAARQADPDDSSEATSAPEDNDDDDDAVNNPPDQQDGDYVPDGLNNLNAIIRRDMIAMYVRVLGFKEGAVTALYDDQQITKSVRSQRLTVPRLSADKNYNKDRQRSEVGIGING